MTEENLQVCRFCQRDVKITYYCESCGTSCCSDCLHEDKVDFLACQDCDSKNVEILHSENKKVCKDCDNENIIKVSQHRKSCPKCHSEKIINIYEKKEELELRFLDLIKNTRTFTEPFKNFINKLKNLKQKVKEARAPPIRCFHFPKMESDLLGIFKSFICLKENLCERIKVHFKYLASNIEYFFNVYVQPNTNIRIIEGILDNLNRSYDSINEFLSNNIKSLKENIEKIEKNLIFIEKITKYFNEYKHFINLADNEKPIYAISAKLSDGVNGIDVFKKSKGMLFITNLDLSFVHEYGLIKKKQDLIFKAPVDDLVRIKEKGKLFKKLYIEFAYGKYEFSLPSDAISRVIEYILLARNFDETNIYNRETSNQLNKINIDLNDLKNFIEDGINKFFIIRCRYDNNQSINDEWIEQYEDENNEGYCRGNFRFKPGRGQFSSSVHNRNRQNTSNQKYSSFHDGEKDTPNIYANSRNNSPKKPNQRYYSKENLNNFWNRELNKGQYRRNKNPSQNPYRNNNPMDFSNTYNRHTRKNRNQSYAKNGNNGFKNHRSRPYSEEEKRKRYRRNPQKYRGQSPSYNNLNSSQGFPSGHFGDFNQEHLNPYFNDPYFSDEGPEMMNPREEMENLKEYLLDLKRERYGIEETLKNLVKMFKQEMISEKDYFAKYQTLKGDLYSINETIKSLQDQMEQRDSFKQFQKDYDNKKYFS